MTIRELLQSAWPTVQQIIVLLGGILVGGLAALSTLFINGSFTAAALVAVFASIVVLIGFLNTEANQRRAGYESFQGLADRVGHWQRVTFPSMTEAAYVAHLRVEVNNELDPGFDDEEIADVILLAIGLAHERGLGVEALVRQKFHRNQRRKWGKPNAEGYVEHVAEGAIHKPRMLVTDQSGGRSYQDREGA